MNQYLHICVIVSYILLSFSVLFLFIRMLIGPSLPDRAAALDVMAMVVICIIAVFSITTKYAIYLDIVIALALISFLGTVAFAQFIEFQLNKTKDDTND